MKTLLVILFSLIAPVFLFCQEIEINGKYSSSTAKQYKNSFGYSFGVNMPLKNHRFGFSVGQLFYNTYYDDIYNSTADGFSKYIEEYYPNNVRLLFDLTYSYKVVNTPSSSLFIGSSVGLNYFKLSGRYDRIGNGNIKGGRFTYDNSVKNRIGLGLLIEYELKKIVSV
jgi:hypothetical protein